MTNEVKEPLTPEEHIASLGVPAEYVTFKLPATAALADLAGRGFDRVCREYMEAVMRLSREMT